METRAAQKPEFMGFPAPEGGPKRASSTFWGTRLELPAKLLFLTIAFVMLAEVLHLCAVGGELPPELADGARRRCENRFSGFGSVRGERSSGTVAAGVADDGQGARGFQSSGRTSAALCLACLTRPRSRTSTICAPRIFARLIPDALEAFAAPPGRLIRVIAAPDIVPGRRRDRCRDRRDAASRRHVALCP